jgi:CRISPR/Cas system-associated exonuclease Cas4 (RecB family)
MVKFLKKAPEKCSICGEDKMIFKRGKADGVALNYCKTCYDSYFKVVETRVRDQVEKAVKSGKMIGTREAIEITKKITSEMEAEQAKKVVSNENAQI